MLIPSVLDAPASTVLPASASARTAATALPDAPPPPTDEQAPLRHLLFGTLHAVQTTIRILYKQGYADPNDWSEPIPTSRPNEVMVILTKRVKL